MRFLVQIRIALGEQKGEETTRWQVFFHRELVRHDPRVV
jgi:hypothetical protein